MLPSFRKKKQKEKRKQRFETSHRKSSLVQLAWWVDLELGTDEDKVMNLSKTT